MFIASVALMVARPLEALSIDRLANSRFGATFFIEIGVQRKDPRTLALGTVRV